MELFKIMNRLVAFDKLVRQENTGTAKEFAKSMHLSVRQMYNVVEELQYYGVPVEYDSQRQTYYYTCAFDFGKFFQEKFSDIQ